MLYFPLIKKWSEDVWLVGQGIAKDVNDEMEERNVKDLPCYTENGGSEYEGHVKMIMK